MNNARIVSFLLLLLLNFFCSIAFAEHSNIRPKLLQIQDIRETAKLADSLNLPILIMFGTEECPYCLLLKEDFLIPMIISGHYTDKIIFREAHVTPEGSLIDFTGKKVSISDFARRYSVRLFPTMVIVDSQGKILVSNIIGITTPSLFGGTLDDSIDQALSLTRGSQ